MRSPFVVLLTSFSVVFSFSPRFSTSVSILFRQSLRLLWKFTLPFRIFKCLVTSSVKSSCRLLLSLTIRLALQTQQQHGDAGPFPVSKNHKYPVWRGCRIPCRGRVQNTPWGGGCKYPMGGRCRIPWGGGVQTTLWGEGAEYIVGGKCRGCKISHGGQNTQWGEGAKYPMLGGGGVGGHWIPYGGRVEYPVEGEGAEYLRGGVHRIPYAGRVQNTLWGQGAKYPAGEGADLSRGSYSEHLESRQ